MVKGNITPDCLTLVRVHRTDLFADVLGERGKRRGMIERTMKLMTESEEPGVIVLLHSFRPNVFAERLGAKSLETADPGRPLREYGIGAEILRELGVRRMVYISDMQPTRVAGLDGYGLSIEGWRPIKEDKT